MTPQTKAWPAWSTLVGLAVIVTLTGCSAIIAMTQKTERTDHPAFVSGSPKEKVEDELGWPGPTTTHVDGSKTTMYTYRRYAPPDPKEPKKSPEARAKRYLLYDLVGVGIPEIAFTAIEAAAKVNRWRDSESCTVSVTYGPDDRILDGNNTKYGCR